MRRYKFKILLNKNYNQIKLYKNVVKEIFKLIFEFLKNN